MSESITTCHLLESYWVVLSEWQKFMVSLQFIFCWRKHFFLMIIQKDFFYLIAITYWKLIPSTQKWVMTCSNITLNIFYLFKKIWLCDVRLYWMMPQDVFFLKSMENCLPQQKYHMKGFQMYNIWKQQHNSLIHPNWTSSSEIRTIQRLEIGRQKSWRQQQISTIPYRQEKFAKSLGNM